MIGIFFNYHIQISGSLPSILNFYNENFYNSQLIATICAETSKEAIQLRELSTILPKSYDATNNPFGIYFVNVLGQNERIENRKSWSNQQESEIVGFQKTIYHWSRNITFKLNYSFSFTCRFCAFFRD